MEGKRSRDFEEESSSKRQRLEQDSPSPEGEITVHAFDDEFLSSPGRGTTSGRKLSPIHEPQHGGSSSSEEETVEMVSELDPFPLTKGASKPVSSDKKRKERRYRGGAEVSGEERGRERRMEKEKKRHSASPASHKRDYTSKADRVKRSSSARNSPLYGERERLRREEVERERREKDRSLREARYEDRHQLKRHSSDWREREEVPRPSYDRGEKSHLQVRDLREREMMRRGGRERGRGERERDWERQRQTHSHSRSPRRADLERADWPVKYEEERRGRRVPVSDSRVPERHRGEGRHLHRREEDRQARREKRERQHVAKEVRKQSDSESDSSDSLGAKQVEEIEELIKDLEESESESESSISSRGEREEERRRRKRMRKRGREEESRSTSESEEGSSSRLSEGELQDDDDDQSSSSRSQEGSPSSIEEPALDSKGRPIVRSKFDESISAQDRPPLRGYSGYDATMLEGSEEEEEEEEEEGEEEMGSEKGGSERQAEPERSPTPELPPYLPALMGCRSVENYEYLNRIEEGTYGVVFRARDKHTGETVALKKLKMEKEREGFPITSLREINMLLKAEHPNIVHVKEIVVGSNMDKIYIVMEYVEHDLKALMESMKQPFLEGEVKTLLIQLLRAVHHLHDNWILHRDLKASNLLLSHKGILKVGDFGLAREYGSPLRNYTPVVVTLWYRAPELLLGAKEYSTAIDMWSVGCIFAEFLLQSPLFRGKSEIDQLNQIFKELGTPNDEIWPGYSELSVPQKVTFKKQPYNHLRKKFPYLTKNGFDLLNRFLTYDPKRRITAEQALEHPYFKEAPLPVDPSMFPTWPAKSEKTSKDRERERSPSAPEGGAFFKQQKDDEDSQGFRIAQAKPGFLLKF